MVAGIQKHKCNDLCACIKGEFIRVSSMEKEKIKIKPMTQRTIKVPEKKYRNMRNALKRQSKIRRLVLELWQILKETKPAK